jgi:hypothetical protein
MFDSVNVDGVLPRYPTPVTPVALKTKIYTSSFPFIDETTGMLQLLEPTTHQCRA